MRTASSNLQARSHPAASENSVLTWSPPGSAPRFPADEPCLSVARRCFRFIGRRSFNVFRNTAGVPKSICCLTVRWGSYTPSSLRRRGRVAEGGGLLNRYTLQRRIEGSNPSVSANIKSTSNQFLNPSRLSAQAVNHDGSHTSLSTFEANTGGTTHSRSNAKFSRQLCPL